MHSVKMVLFRGRNKVCEGGVSHVTLFVDSGIRRRKPTTGTPTHCPFRYIPFHFLDMASKPLARLSRCMAHTFRLTRRPQCRHLTSTAFLRSEALNVVRSIHFPSKPVSPFINAMHVSIEIAPKTIPPYHSNSTTPMKNSLPKSSNVIPPNTKKPP